jgi:hypothetical protein
MLSKYTYIDINKIIDTYNNTKESYVSDKEMWEMIKVNEANCQLKNLEEDYKSTYYTKPKV